MDFDDPGFQAYEPEQQAPHESPMGSPAEQVEHPPLPPLHAVSAAAQRPRAPQQRLQRVSPRRPPSAPASRAKAGLGAIAAAAGLGAGAVLAGPLGALAGVAGVGAVRNLYRSQALASSDEAERSDGARSFALGIIGLAIVGAVGYKLWNSRE